MHTELDHIVWATPDLDGLVAHVSRWLGIDPVEGGPHDGYGVRNCLLGLGGHRYLELIGPDPNQPEPRQPRPFNVDNLTGPRLVGWAACTSHIENAVAAAQAAGYDPGDPRPMARDRPDGIRLEWLLTPPQGGLGGTAPFLIDWLDCEHPSSKLPTVEMVSLTLHHPEPDQVRTALQALRFDDQDVVTVHLATQPSLSLELDAPTGRHTVD